MKTATYSETLQKRGIIYAFLKGIYETELSRKFLAEMPRKMKPLLSLTEVFSHAEAKKAVQELIQFTSNVSPKNIDDLQIRLAADYARLFLSINKIPPHPSESVYREGTMMQYSRDEVLRAYWSFGVDKTKNFTEPEDHIAVELSFLAYLCEKAHEALEKGDKKEAKRYMQGQKDFLENHLVKWLPRLVKDIRGTARTPFYKSIAVLTQEFVETDLSLAKELIEKLGT